MAHFSVYFVKNDLIGQALLNISLASPFVAHNALWVLSCIKRSLVHLYQALLLHHYVVFFAVSHIFKIF